jgi:hypothetical protein
MPETCVELSGLSPGYCDELAAYILSPAGTGWAKYAAFTPEMESLARHIQTAVEEWLTEHRPPPTTVTG